LAETATLPGVVALLSVGVNQFPPLEVYAITVVFRLEPELA
jgi:hypothetical protein